MLKWVKTLLRVVANYDQDIAGVRRQTLSALRLIKARTQVHADVHFKDTADQIIVVGRYRKHDYIQVFSVINDDFCHLVEQLKDMQKHGTVRRIDAPPQMDVAYFRQHL